MFVGLIESFLCRFVETIVLYLSSSVYDLLKFMICTICINHRTKVV